MSSRGEFSLRRINRRPSYSSTVAVALEKTRPTEADLGGQLRRHLVAIGLVIGLFGKIGIHLRSHFLEFHQMELIVNPLHLVQWPDHQIFVANFAKLTGRNQAAIGSNASYIRVNVAKTCSSNPS